MIRRTFLTMFIIGMTGTASASVIGLAPRRFFFKIKTQDGGIVGNVLIEASDVEAANSKLMKRYPGCSILSVMEK